MIAQCSSCNKTFEIEDTGAQYCPHCGTHVYVEAPHSPGGMSGGPTGGERWEGAESSPDWSPRGGSGDEGGPAGSNGESSPFERRGEIGFLNGFFLTVKMALFDPASLFRRMRVDNVDGAFLFGWLCLTIGLLAGNIWNFVTSAFSPGPSATPELDELPPELAELLETFITHATGPGNLVASLLLSPVIAAIGILIAAAMVHLGVLVFGANNHGWNASFRAACYGSTPWLIGVVPLCGSLIGMIWALVLTITAIFFLQRTTPLKASLAVLIWFLVCCLCCCLGGLLMGGLMSQAVAASGMG